jgi:hypothetical protein
MNPHRSGQVPRALTAGWQGALLRVGCLQPLTQVIAKVSSVILEHDPVPGSIWVESASDVTFEFKDRKVVLSEEAEGLIHYRPQLLMRVVDFHLETKEMEMVSPWKLILEEV